MKRLALLLAGALVAGLTAAAESIPVDIGIAGIALGSQWEEVRQEVGAQDVRCDKLTSLNELRRAPTQICSFQAARASKFVGKELTPSMHALLRDGVVIGLTAEVVLEGPAKGIEFSTWAEKTAEVLRLTLRRTNSLAVMVQPDSISGSYSPEKLALSPVVYTRFNPTTTEVNLVVGSQELVQYFIEMTAQ